MDQGYNTIVTVYRGDIPVTRAHWSARYEASSGEGLRSILLRLAERHNGPEFKWFVTVVRA